jgi:hypothetical protein
MLTLLPAFVFLCLQEKGLEAVPLLADGNLVDQAWGAERPGLPTAPLRVHDATWAGASIQQKVDEVRPGFALLMFVVWTAVCCLAFGCQRGHRQQAELWCKSAVQG